MLDERLAIALAAWPADRPAVVDEEQTPPRVVTFGEHRAMIDRYRDGLTDLGVGRGHLVPLLARQTPESVAVICALLLEGAAFCFLSERFEPADRRVLIERMNPVGLITDDYGATLLDDSDRDMFPLIRLHPGGLDAPVNAPGTGSAAFDDIAEAHFSSGSTGAPKAVLGTRDGLEHFADVQIAGSGVTAVDRLLCIVGFSSNLGLVQIFTALFSGAALHLSRARGKELGDVIRRSGITGVGGSTPMWTAALAEGSPDAPLFGDVPTLRYIFTGGLHMPRSRLRRLFTRLGPDVTVYEIYGQAEVRQMTHFPINAPEHQHRIDSVGRTVEGSVLFVAIDENTVAPSGTVGEIAHIGPGIMRGYLGEPALTTAQLRTHRAFPGRTVVYTGDLGYQDDDGYIFLTGRASRVITLDDGTWLWPDDVESALADAHPEVVDAVAVGLRIADRPVVAVAVVASGGVTAADLRTSLISALPAPTVLHHLALWAQLPTTPNGKPAVARIATMLAAEIEGPR
ncbi:class I adenylate-forming enzyme family protein [Nocardia sp. NPDC004568]|uniref:class I adenylate-forming enzyme family protein n=1 Tax=Nocardia sp. NPDC004568 TaxID=3154551 RepID=UPI0033B4F26D